MVTIMAGIVRLPGLQRQLKLETDSSEYEQLYDAAQAVKQVPGTICELGVRFGGSMEIIMLSSVGGLDRLYIGIDPWGTLPYYIGKEPKLTGFKYPNEMRLKAQTGLYTLAEELKMNLVLLPMLDTVFFDVFKQGFPRYHDGIEYLEKTYALVHFDAEHTTNAVMREVDFFHSRSSVGAMWVFDDINLFDFDAVSRRVLDMGFIRYDKKNSTRRATFRKEH